jgi:TonB family protein
MPMLERNSGTEVGRPLPHAAFEEQQQRRRMLVALGVLLVALISVLIKDRQFWFPPSPSAESETPEQVAPLSNPAAPPVKTIVPIAPAKPAATAASHLAAKLKRRATAPTETQGGMSPVIVATNRAVLPPLEVEVVAGDQHRAFTPADSSVKLDMQPSPPDGSEPIPASGRDTGAAQPPAAAHVQLSPRSAQVISRVNPSYPLLAKQMKVQGAVVLEALISRSGSIQDIQVLSGPAILSEAAREAVKQWHFKPYYQGGRPVETEARITVNFTISTY